MGRRSARLVRQARTTVCTSGSFMNFIRPPSVSKQVLRCCQIKTSARTPIIYAPVSAPSPLTLSTLHHPISLSYFGDMCSALNQQQHTTPFILAWEFSFRSMSFYSFSVHTVLPAVLLFSWMLWEIIESAVYGAVCCNAPTSSCLVNTVSLKPPL